MSYPAWKEHGPEPDKSAIVKSLAGINAASVGFKYNDAGEMLLPDPSENRFEYVHDRECGTSTFLTAEQKRLFRLGLFPVRCGGCGDVLVGGGDA